MHDLQYGDAFGAGRGSIWRPIHANYLVVALLLVVSMSSSHLGSSSNQLKGKCARKSTSAKPPPRTPTPTSEPELDYDNEKDPEVAAAIKAARVLEALQFSNPGRQNSDVPSPSKRSRRSAFEKAKQKTATLNEGASTSKAPVAQICDCIRPECKGCFPKCKKCSSRKCGRYCQVNRTWTVVECVIPGSTSKPLKNEAAMTYAETDEEESESSTCSEED
uniref:ARF7EP_C domain-containing protein n=1 Tax=Panagrellus redivivus TaxID=6233 RepID=A0A7E4V161_PANRE